MDLDERKKKILGAVIEHYICTAEPVGSRTISKLDDLGVSSATVRNEMSDLEDMGLLIQPHTSAGRIPSTLGYRTYVDRLMKKIRIFHFRNQQTKVPYGHSLSEADGMIKELTNIYSYLPITPLWGLSPGDEGRISKKLPHGAH